MAKHHSFPPELKPKNEGNDEGDDGHGGNEGARTRGSHRYCSTTPPQPGAAAAIRP
jgi:hypothetical protein